jgi:hypothetical protein
MTRKTTGRRLTADVGRKRAAAAQRAGKRMAVEIARPLEAVKPASAVPESWLCNICGAKTSGSVTTCWKCKSERGAGREASEPPVPGGSGNIPAGNGKALAISVAEYSGLQAAFDWMRDRLFKPLVNVDLPDVVLLMMRRGGSKGHFGNDRFSARADHRRLHEININPDANIGRTDKQIASTLCHEMAHLADLVLDPKGVGASESYHRKQWVGIMLAVGLVPSHNEQPGGKMTGKSVSHYILPDGPFDRAMDELIATGWKLRLESTPRIEAEKTRTSKPQLTCALCGQQAGTAKLAACCLPCLATALSKWTDRVSLTDEERIEISDIVRDTAFKFPEVAGISGGPSARIEGRELEEALS